MSAVVDEDISAKLHRADDHIEHLKRAFKALWREDRDRELIDGDSEAEKAFRDLHAQRRVPPDLMVVVGEAIYQMRSSLDHLICALVLADGGTPTSATQFPIFRFEPIGKDEVRRYQRQVAGITRPEVLALIKAQQPYLRGDDRDRWWLAILKVLNNTDKHRALVLNRIHIKPKVMYSLDYGTDVSTYARSAPGTIVPIVDMKRKLATGVAFAQFGEAITDYPVVKGLRDLSAQTWTLAGELAALVP